ncbi:hypothetical protein BMF94_5155 [Rhodotorula taiwanensis]|uniref:U3 small nucleolar RNA-associated protein 22 n=1 Tax=Rhodotorula taiwanensis TaxID=741276 RepID=A0A2S5B4U1_9BASI|nr:hypothetical protein BMF94_5155 [Rhodotorula taiwanensis]
MAAASKRAATSAPARPAPSKKARPAQSAPPVDSQQSEDDDELDLAASDDESLGSGFEDLEQSGDEDGTSEDEFAAGQDLEGESDGDQMISDDGEDLYANLDDDDDDDDDAMDSELGESSGDEPVAVGAPAAADDDDDGGWETVGTAPSAPLIAPAAELEKRKRAKVPKLSAAELRALAFAELTASPISNVLATRVAALLDPLTPAPSTSSPMQPVLKELHAALTGVSKQKPTSLDALRKKGRVVPKAEGTDGKWAKLELAWEAPRSEDIRVIGNWAWGGAIKQKGEYFVDIAVAMPAALLQPKDCLAPRWSAKATHYLVTLAQHLPPSLGPVQLSYAPLGQGHCLEIRSALPKGESKVGLSKAKGAVLRVRVVTPEGVFADAKTSPTTNLARPPSLASAFEGNNPQVDPSTLPLTPLHSTALHLSSLPLQTAHLRYLHSLSTSFPAFTSSVRLLQTWAIRRGYAASLGLSTDWWAWCVARSLNAGGKIAGGDSASLAAGGEGWAGWRKAIEWLSTANWTEGVWLKSSEEKYTKADFKRAFAGRPIFVDPTGSVNLAAGIELSTLEMLKYDAREVISVLLANIEDERKFDSAFNREIQPTERFDNFVRWVFFETVAAMIVLPASPAVDADAAVDFADPFAYLTSAMCATLKRALGSRVRNFAVSPAPLPATPVEGKAAKPSTTRTLSIGFILDPVDSLRLVDQGPSAEDDEACADFRAFWGAKSELRRFQDGAIVESVVWDEVGSNGLGQQRTTIVRRVVEYILQERHGVPLDNISFFAGAFDHLLVEPEAVRRSIYLEDSVVSGKGFSNIISAFDDLAKEIKDLPDLPLTVSAVHPCAPGLRYSSPFIPSPRRLKDYARLPLSLKYLDAHDIILTFEGSGRWPDDLEGIQKIKAAFLSKLGEGLEATRAVLRAELVFSTDSRPIDDNVALEILTASGWAFRARVFYDRSQTLLEEREDQLGAAAAAPSDDVLSSLDLYLERFVHAPKHHAAISALQNHFPSFSPTVRLLKRWISAHLLSAHFVPEQLELLVASVFLDSASPFGIPNSGATGFARVIERLASWKWRDEPALVPIYTFTTAITSGRRANLPTAERAEVVASFQARRLSRPSIDTHAWVIATENDLEGVVWGRRTSKVAAARVRSLAIATLATLRRGVLEGDLVVEQLFSPPMGDYAFLIHLDPSAIPRHFQALAADPAALSSRQRSSVLSGSLMGGLEDEDEEIRIGWDPVAAFVEDLRTTYGSVFLLFHSEHGAPTIGAIWNPAAEAPKAFKVGLGYPIKPVRDDDGGKAKVVLDKKAVYREIERLGKGLVSKVDEVRRL